REIAHTDLGRHDTRRVLGVIESEKVTDLMQRHGAHGLLVEHLALVVMHRENDVRIGDEPLVVASPFRASTDWLAEVVDPVHMYFGVRGIIDENEAEW